VVLVWDNSHSFFRAKRIAFLVRVLRPEGSTEEVTLSPRALAIADTERNAGDKVCVCVCVGGVRGRGGGNVGGVGMRPAFVEARAMLVALVEAAANGCVFVDQVEVKNPATATGEAGSPRGSCVEEGPEGRGGEEQEGEEAAQVRGLGGGAPCVCRVG
jgi:hypothetical protein